jgi:vacuolar-type H+-ATPase subunit I/STV1
MSDALRDRDEYIDELIEDNMQLEAEMTRLSDGIMKLAAECVTMRRGFSASAWFPSDDISHVADKLQKLAGRKLDD